MDKLTRFLDGINIGEPQHFANMQIFPLHLPNGHVRRYRTLEDALNLGEIEILEVSEGGSVPSLTVVNKGELPVLMVIGEELVGAKQNRILNTSILVPAQSQTQIPVSCVERGRWAYSSRDFTTSSSTAHLKLRKGQTENVTKNLRAHAAYDADQSQVWAEVDRKLDSTGSSSQTAALRAAYEQNETRLKDYLEQFNPPDAQGILVTINNEVVGVDLFDHAETLKTLWSKILRGYAFDALERSNQAAPVLATEGGPAPSQDGLKPDDTRPFLKAAIQAVEEIYASVGLGEDVRLSGDEVTGSGLLWEDSLIHASLFSAKI